MSKSVSRIIFFFQLEFSLMVPRSGPYVSLGVFERLRKSGEQGRHTEYLPTLS